MSLIKKKVVEEPVCDVQFNINKFSSRQKPKDPNKIIIISCFSEFGCEILGVMYCIPRLLKQYKDHYFVVIGWHGRSYLYHHLVDEFWELKEDFQFLRDKAMAFHHVSKNLLKIEKHMSNFGKVFNSDKLGGMVIGNTCNRCSHFWGDYSSKQKCSKCNANDVTRALFSDVRYWKQRMHPIPMPSPERNIEAFKYIKGEKPIGIVARNRSTYGRNLQPEFYINLIKKVESLGYTPIWLGEKQSTLVCPLPHILDFSRMPESRDLELTLAIVAKLKFTIQFWTASTRLAAIVETPYLLFESPDQLFGQGQEGYRMALTTTGKKKLALCHYLKVYNDNDKAIELVERCIKEMEQDNWDDIIGMVDEPDIVEQQREQNLHRLAGI
jgi:hypothetical protein